MCGSCQLNAPRVHGAVRLSCVCVLSVLPLSRVCRVSRRVCSKCVYCAALSMCVESRLFLCVCVASKFICACMTCSYLRVAVSVKCAVLSKHKRFFSECVVKDVFSLCV